MTVVRKDGNTNSNSLKSLLFIKHEHHQGNLYSRNMSWAIVLESTLKEYVMLSKKTKEILTVAMANEKAAKELASAIEELQAKVAELEEELEEDGE